MGIGKKLAIGCFGVMVLTCAGVPTLLWSIGGGRPTIAVDYEAKLNERAAAVPEGDRAWPIYRELTAELQSLEELDSLVLDRSLTPESVEMDRLRLFVEANASLVERARAAGSKPGLGYVTSRENEASYLEARGESVDDLDDGTGSPRWLLLIELPHLSDARSMARLLAADLRVAAAEGSGDRVVRDLGSMHVLAGTRLSAANRATFRTAMENSKSFPTWETGGRDLMQRISDEAARRNFTLGRRIAFGGELEIAYKAGTYSLRNGNFVSEAEWTSVPCLVASGTITRREYVFGAFNAQAGARSVARGLVSDALLDAVWPLVRDAMETWDDGGIGRYGQGCPGARGVASLDSRDVPNIGTTVDLELAELPVAAPVSFWFGIRSTTPLPIPGTACELLLQPLHSVSTTSRYPGAATIPLSIPGDSTLAGVRLAVQCSVMDASANLLGFSFSNGLELRIGQ